MSPRPSRPQEGPGAPGRPASHHADCGGGGMQARSRAAVTSEEGAERKSGTMPVWSMSVPAGVRYLPTCPPPRSQRPSQDATHGASPRGMICTPCAILNTKSACRPMPQQPAWPVEHHSCSVCEVDAMHVRLAQCCHCSAARTPVAQSGGGCAVGGHGEEERGRQPGVMGSRG